MMRGKRKRVSPRGSRLESGMNAMAVRRLFILEFSICPRSSESQSDHLARSGELDGWVCKRQNL